MTDEQRKELIELTKAKKEEKAKALETKQSEEDKKLLEEAKEYGIDVEKYTKKPSGEEKKLENKDENNTVEILGKALGTAITEAIKNVNKTEEPKKEVKEIYA